MNRLSHLSESAAALLDAPLEARLELVRTPPFVLHPEGVAALEWLSYMRRFEYGRDRPANLHIVGKAGMGKSSLFRHYFTQHGRPTGRDAEGQMPCPVVLIEAPEDGDYKKLCLRLIQACVPGYQPPLRGNFTEACEDVLFSSAVRQILIDEAGNLFLAGRLAQQRSLAFLKRLSNRGLTIALTTPENDRNVLSADQQLSSRFMEWPLPQWSESNELRSFLAGLEANLPLPQPSDLSGKTLVRWFLARQLVVTDSIVKVVSTAASIALMRNESRLSIGLLTEAVERRNAPDSRLQEPR